MSEVKSELSRHKEVFNSLISTISAAHCQAVNAVLAKKGTSSPLVLPLSRTTLSAVKTAYSKPTYRYLLLLTAFMYFKRHPGESVPWGGLSAILLGLPVLLFGVNDAWRYLRGALSESGHEALRKATLSLRVATRPAPFPGKLLYTEVRVYSSKEGVFLKPGTVDAWEPLSKQDTPTCYLDVTLKNGTRVFSFNALTGAGQIWFEADPTLAELYTPYVEAFTTALNASGARQLIMEVAEAVSQECGASTHPSQPPPQEKGQGLTDGSRHPQSYSSEALFESAPHVHAAMAYAKDSAEFARLLDMPAPDELTRRAILTALLDGKTVTSDVDVALNLVAKTTQGKTGRYLELVVQAATHKAMKRALAHGWPDAVVLQQKDFLEP